MFAERGMTRPSGVVGLFTGMSLEAIHALLPLFVIGMLGALTFVVG